MILYPEYGQNPTCISGSSQTFDFACAVDVSFPLQGFIDYAEGGIGDEKGKRKVLSVISDFNMKYY